MYDIILNMDTDNIIVPLVISIVYLFSKIIEMKFIVKENKPLKELFRDTLIVYISSVLGMYVMEQFDNTINLKNTQVFTGNPDF